MDLPALQQGEGIGDPYDLIMCPYDPAHMIQRYKMQTHLMKCAKQNKKSHTKTCPFNTKHVIPEEKFDHHVRTCSDRIMLDHVKYNIDPASDMHRETAQAPEVAASEDWENEDNTPFDPTANLASHIMRYKRCVPPSERKAFRAEQIKNYRNN